MRKLLLIAAALPVLGFAQCFGDKKCIQDQLKAAYSQHQAIYDEYLSTLSKDEASAFRSEQRGWIETKELACRIEADKNGSSAESRDAIYSECETREERERSEYIYSLLVNSKSKNTKNENGQRATLAEYKAYLNYVATETTTCVTYFKVNQFEKGQNCVINIKDVIDKHGWKMDNPDISGVTTIDKFEIERDVKRFSENAEAIKLYMSVD